MILVRRTEYWACECRAYTGTVLRTYLPYCCQLPGHAPMIKSKVDFGPVVFTLPYLFTCYFLEPDLESISCTASELSSTQVHTNVASLALLGSAQAG